MNWGYRLSVADLDRVLVRARRAIARIVVAILAAHLVEDALVHAAHGRSGPAAWKRPLGEADKTVMGLLLKLL